MKGRLLGIAVLVAWGLIKTPIEIRMTEEREQERFGGFKLTANLREQAGQAGFVAVLGGLRAPVADMLWIKAHNAWGDVQYGRMKLLFDVCTSLQPRRENFWDMAAWHMAWNGSVNVERDPLFRTDEERQKEVEKYWKLGEDYLRHGIENNPDSWLLWERLAGLYWQKMKDHCKAAQAYAEAAKRPGHLPYVRRLAAIYLADCPGHEREAYEKLLGLYHEGQQEWLPTLLQKLQLLERKLGIPKEQRVDIPPKDRLPPE